MFIQIVTTIIVLFLLSRVAAKFRRKEISASEAFAWGFLWLAVGVVVLYPSLADEVAKRLGLLTATGIDLAVYLAVGVAYYLIFRIVVRLEKIERNITKLVRHVAIKEHDKKE